jgi:hypothetical protein
MPCGRRPTARQASAISEAHRREADGGIILGCRDDPQSPSGLALGAPLRVKTHAAPAASKGPPTMAVLPSTLIVRPNELLFRFALGRGVAAVGNRCSDLTVLDQVFEDETLCRIAEVPEETRRACNEARP